MDEAVKQRDPERSKHRILLTAEQLFAEKGPAAGVDLIARKSGLNKRMIYHYFGSKAGLWQAVLLRQYEKAARVEADLPPDKSLSDVTAELVERYYRFLAGDRVFVKILMHENLQRGRSVRKIPVAHTKFPLLAALEKSIRAARLPHLDPDNLLIDCLALCFFYFSNAETLATLFETDLQTPKNLGRRIDHVKQIVRMITAADSAGPAGTGAAARGERS